MTTLNFYLNRDHAARRHVMYVSVGAGALLGGSAEALGLSFRVAAIACVLAVGATEIGGASRYVKPSWKARHALGTFRVRRSLIASVTAMLVLFIIANLRIPQMEALACEQVLKRVSAGPENPESVAEARKVLVRARSAEIRIPPATIEETGRKFVDASKRDTAVWNDALEFVDYKTYINEGSFKIPSSRGATPVQEFYRVVLPNYALVSTFGVAPSASSARFNSIGVDINQGKPQGFGLIFAEGGSWILDGYELKNVVFKNSHFVYHGGPLRVTNVYFVGCTFEMDPTPNSQNLALAILAPGASTTFLGN